MREILFRGQTRRKGEKVRMDGSPVESNWVYGGVLQGTGDHSIIYQTEPDIEKKVVYTDTLGQYTGLTDKNGTKIFEGDIVKGTAYSGKFVGIIVWIDEIGGFGVRYRKRQEATAWENSSILKCASKGRTDEFTAEIIGNIYDNPELIGGADDENNNRFL